MAAVQRKLVHKQFNSPMGLYSQENVKATLNRELKAFGADGIEIDDQITKPLNLANSAVLRAVEEEEQQIKCGDFYARPRQSRTRQRDSEDPKSPVEPPHHALHQQLLDQIKTQYLSHQHDVVIDRDTVLRINRMSTTRRHLLRRDHSWPPGEQEAAGTATVHSVTPSPTHSIDVLREKFNSPTRIVEPSPREVRQQRIQLESSASPKQQKQGNTPPPNAKPQDEPKGSSCRQTPQAKGFSAPETKAADADIGLVAPKCEYYEQLMHQRPTTPTLKASSNYRPRLKRQSYSLDRGRARKRAVAMGGGTELPPPKPRNGSGSGNGTPKVQRRSIKLATELKISYDTDTANDGDSEEEPKASAAAAAVDIDLETLPLPATPSERAATAAAAAAADTAKLMTKSLPRKAATVIDSLALKQQQQMALALATAAFDAQSSGGRIIPVTVSAETSRSAHPGQLLGSVQQIYDDACSYLRQDQQQPSMTPPTNTEDTTLPATYVSATKGIKLQRQDSAPRLKPQGSHQSCIPTPPPLPPPPPPPLLQLRAKTRQEAKDMQARRQGGIYDSNPETLPALAKQHEAHVEIAQLEAKYAHIQQSITEHLRQIDAYMENAKTALQRTVQPTPTPTEPPPSAAAKPLSSGNHNNNNELWDMFASRQSPILAVESPLQAILRQIYCRAAGIQLLPKEQVMSEMHLQPVMPAENVPIVERALEDLHKIAIALDSDEHALLHVEHKTTPTAAKAQHVVIAEEEEQQQQQQDTAATASHVAVEEGDLSLDYRHVSDVIANYEQLSTGKAAATAQRQELPLGTDKQDKQSPTNQLGGKESTVKHQVQQESISQKSIKEKEELGEEKKKLKEQQQQETVQPEEKLKEQQPEAEAEQTVTPGCPHEPTATEDILGGSCCAICGECRDSPHGWGKLTKADQWRFDNLQNEPLANYKSTYEIRSPYVSRQISWEDTQQQQPQPQQREPKEQLQRQRSVVEIVTTPAATAAPAESKDWQLSRSPSPLPYRRYPAPLIDTAQRCSSPFGLNAVQPKGSTTPTPTPMEAKYTHVSQLEGHNIGLLVSTATEPLQLSMSASSSLLAATPPTTPRCNSQPPPFEFLVQHGLGAQAELPHLELGFKSLAGSEERLRDFSVHRSFDNVSPRPYIGIEGYKRVAWPPASEERIVREFTPQPPSQSPAPGSGGYYPQSGGQPVPSAAPAQL
ncbi:uncharacterized protein LOC135429632 isoform X7 [Drosophila montana]|uniref:uncharacterized protein LOC135429632 isoform X7 n=1 Tax=Drosophila montana TaxID=40370 RepID=UPI00313DB853